MSSRASESEPELLPYGSSRPAGAASRPVHRRSKLTRRVALGVGGLMVASGLAAIPLALSASAATTATVTVAAGTSLGTVPATAFGLNTAVFDQYLTDSSATTLMKAAGVTQLRYPGGSYSDMYHWKTNTIDGSGYVAANTDFDHFMATAKSVGADPMLIANYGDGTATEAAAWVSYANVTKGYGVKHWEIGNEVYGNGHYGSAWENDTHADKSPTAYAKAVVAYAKAMKAVDPTVKIGAVLTTPGNWPDGIVASGDSADWNNTVLSIAGGSIDFVSLHWYPTASSTAALLQTPTAVAGATSTVKALIAKYTSRAVAVSVTETDGLNSPARTSQAAALYAPDTYMTWLEQGINAVDWWDLHNGAGTVATVDGQTDYKDEGVLSNGSCGSGGVCEPAHETPFPTYFGLKSLTALASPGDTMVKANSTSTLVGVHAVKAVDGGLNVMLINKSPDTAATVALSYTGYTPASGAVTTVSYLKNGTTLATKVQGTATLQTLPAYSITTLKLAPSTGTASTAASASASATAAPTATATSTATATTGPSSGAAACKVAYTTDDWGSGFTASVTVTNTGASALSGWKVSYTYAGSQALSGTGWNGSWSQSGRTVTVTNAGWNGSLAVGGSATAGANFSYGGSNAAPTAFTVNGSACTTA